ncbi:hypothetical protein PLICRDRAFT_43157 [Plicaturopsis crispa FD-325 SS-3]|nr:hypothetical protein PLICRDRAFT_43157 [Plicaturopsis crispa FD-325 SS-3]
MSSAANDGDVFGGSSSRLLSPTKATPRRSPSKQSLSSRHSTASLRGSSSLAHAHVVDDDSANGRHSLAHELAAALMPEPSAGSKLLAEEFGIEYDEGAEGIDEDSQMGPPSPTKAKAGPSFADEQGDPQTLDAAFQDAPASPSYNDTSADHDPTFGTPATPKRKKRPEQDSLEMLSQDLASTDKFLNHLRRLDVDPSSSIAPLEKIASDVIRRLNETARDREGQVRELLEYEREFRKISGERGGSDVLGQLEELVDTEELSEQTSPVNALRPDPPSSLRMDSVEEDPPAAAVNDWELDPEQNRLGDEDENEEDDDDDDTPAPSPIKDSFPQPPPVVGYPTPAKTIPHLAHLRTFTSSLITSLSTISEQAQVNGAATAEAGRKIRALKNKLGGWRTDWDNAERSRVRIEKWEAGVEDNETFGGAPMTPVRSPSARRIDGRKMVQEHLQAFEKALADAGVKTQAIMAAS